MQFRNIFFCVFVSFGYNCHHLLYRWQFTLVWECEWNFQHQHAYVRPQWQWVQAMHTHTERHTLIPRSRVYRYMRIADTRIRWIHICCVLTIHSYPQDPFEMPMIECNKCWNTLFGLASHMRLTYIDNHMTDLMWQYHRCILAGPARYMACCCLISF